MTITINNLAEQLKNEDLNTIAPNFRKGFLTSQEIDAIIKRIAREIAIPEKEALAGIMLLMLKGAASSGTPQTLSIDLRDGKTLTKKNITAAYLTETGNSYLRRLAEGLATQIGEFAEHFGLQGELSQRINTMLKAETGETLTPKEVAWCSSFSQNVPDLANRSSERLVKLLAEDYKRRFENKKKSVKEPYNNNNKKRK